MNSKEPIAKVYLLTDSIGNINTDGEEILDVFIIFPIPIYFYVELENVYNLIIEFTVKNGKDILGITDLIKNSIKIKNVDIIKRVCYYDLKELGEITDLFNFYEILLQLILFKKTSTGSIYQKDFLLGFLHRLETYSINLLL